MAAEALLAEAGCLEGIATVARLICGLYAPTDGTITCAGDAVGRGHAGLATDRFRRQIRMVFQDLSRR